MLLRITSAAVIFCGMAGCQSRPETMDDLARKYVSLSVQLGERDFDSLDFVIGDKAVGEPESFARLHDDAIALRNQVSALPGETSRKTMLVGQLDALAMRTRLLQGSNYSFDEESRMLFGVTASADTDVEDRKAIRAKVATLLGKAANPAAAYSKYEAQFVVPQDRVPVVMKAALEQCRAVTLAHMTLPAGEHVDVGYVSHKPWSAYSWYLGRSYSIIQVNMDYPLTVDRILNLACHEGYPGHHVFNSMRDQALVQTLHRDEFRVQPTFSPQSYVSEAAANYAPSLLTEQDRLHIDRDVLIPLAGLKDLDVPKYLAIEKLVDGLHTAEPFIARDYLDGRLEFVRAADALEREALMEHPEAMLLYLNQFRTYMLAYTVGSDAVQTLVEAGSPSDAERWRRYIKLMTSPVASLPAAEQK